MRRDHQAAPIEMWHAYECVVDASPAETATGAEAESFGVGGQRRTTTLLRRCCRAASASAVTETPSHMAAAQVGCHMLATSMRQVGIPASRRDSAYPVTVTVASVGRATEMTQRANDFRDGAAAKQGQKMSRDDPRQRGERKPTCLHPYDRAIIEFFMQWAPYGGPPDEDLFPRFGLTSDQLVARIDSIVGAHHAGHLLALTDRELIGAASRVLGIIPTTYTSAGGPRTPGNRPWWLSTRRAPHTAAEYGMAQRTRRVETARKEVQAIGVSIAASATLNSLI